MPAADVRREVDGEFDGGVVADLGERADLAAFEGRGGSGGEEQ